MKKLVYVFLLAITAAAFSSCHKSGVKLFVGDYSFKTSGEVSIITEAVIDSMDIVIPAVLNVNLTNEIGQLNISVSDKKNDEVLVVINFLNGAVVVTNGTCEGEVIELDEFEVDVLPVSISSMFTYYKIKASGTGRMYDENMIVFDMNYKGTAKTGSVTYSFRDKDAKMVAYRN